ncbi:MAG: Cof-type HAD-IIB family hydrolase [Clostridia bacterium]
MIKLIASDLDGTMFEKGNIIPETNLKAIDDINNSNINFTICTGKTYSLFKNICQDIGTGYGIFGNGNQIINLKTGEEIYRKLLKNEDVLFCINTAKKLNLHVHLYTNKEVITEKLLYMDLRNFELTKNDKNIDLEFKIVTDIQEYIEKENPEILKLVISAEKDLASLKNEFAKNKNLQVNLIRKVDKYRDEIIGKEYEYLDIMPAGINKEQALEVLENYLKIDKSEVLAIGDNLNDLEMIKDSGVGIAVANAYDEVKEVANYTTTTTAQNGGFAEAVYKFIEFK